ncbi:MAPK regulated corepressor interacting protein 2-like [Brienomyrus brachyistius]|uniref:MAPK regulated corepressor interacting protein 2-like n=1 Tax=Brienomyrus brachyistius TaxID=42636 RepID=UPI0020B2EB53|nr:MAPK regulated corepressor interacting protein 2-like [Brienomyrus brachyistius]
MMYTITKGPSKLVTQRRTGPTQQIDIKVSEAKIKSGAWALTNSPPAKLVFQPLNGKRHHRAAAQQHEGFTAAHEENVKFVNEAWQEVKQQLKESNQSEQGQGPVQYLEKTPNTSMKNFVPFDLEEWWAQRFLANIANLA